MRLRGAGFGLRAVGNSLVCRRRLAAIIFVTALLVHGHFIYAQEAKLPAGQFTNRECLACHTGHDKAYVKDWRAGAHGKDKAGAGCVACHGKTHQGSLASARDNAVCIRCHGGDKAASVHSYATSKHGVLYRLEGQDHSKPLSGANYRTPGCAYCHMHQGNHDVSRTVRRDVMDPQNFMAMQDALRVVCQDCHAPRYVTRLFENNEAMLEIGRKKLREAEALLRQAEAEFGRDKTTAMEARLNKMRRHLRNVLLGLAHQSPDYQWWLGQPALDGDLLRLKGMLGDLRRRAGEQR